MKFGELALNFANSVQTCENHKHIEEILDATETMWDMILEREKR